MMAEDTRQKRSGFSALAGHGTNGMARTSSKSGASKKIVIKNFKGIYCFPPLPRSGISLRELDQVVKK